VEKRVTEFHVRKAKRKDIPALRVLLTDLSNHELSYSAVEDRLRLIEESPIDELYVLEQEDRILGLLGFRIRENVEEPSRYGEISAIVTLKETRHGGIGRALMEYAEKRAIALGCKGAWLVSGFGREEEAHGFYRKLGYEITGYRFVKSFESD
jgi:N-acetylglutamate synthase-like GNAT family acetyltransferase